MAEKRVALVLGAGGVVGHAFHAGVLDAITQVTGWDPGRADLIVGTSAGSIVGALLRAGVAPSDLTARADGRVSTGPGAEALRRWREAQPSKLPEPESPDPAKVNSDTLLSALRRPWEVRATSVVATMLRRGTVPTEPIRAGLRQLYGTPPHDRWPELPLWLPAVRIRDARRVVFGSPGAPPASVADAVAASCAVPGYFRPVRIATPAAEVAGKPDGFGEYDEYVDGGAHSPTNMDLVTGLEVDLVVVVAPMSATQAGLRSSSDLPVRAITRAALEAERMFLSRRQVRVVSFLPTERDIAVMGSNAMDRSRHAAVVHQARSSARDRLAEPAVRDLLGGLA